MELVASQLITLAPAVVLLGAALVVLFTAWRTDGLEDGSRWVVGSCALLLALCALASAFAPITARWGIVLSLLPGFLIIQYGVVQASVRRPGRSDPESTGIESRLRPAAERVRRSVQSVFSPAVIGTSYGLPALLSAAVLGTAFFTLSLKPDATGGEAYVISKDFVAGARWGLLGAYVLVLLRLGQRAVTRDMTTGVVIWAVISLMLGPIVGGLASMAWRADAATMNNWQFPAVCFVAGFSPRWFISVMEETIKRLVAPASGAQVAGARIVPLTSIRGISTDVAERLAEENIADVNALAMADPVRLFRNTNYSKRLILDWMDEAILLINLPEAWQGLERLGITGAIDLAWTGEEGGTAISTLAQNAHLDATLLQGVARRLYEDVQVQLVWFLYQYEEGLSPELEPATAAVAAPTPKTTDTLALPDMRNRLDNLEKATMATAKTGASASTRDVSGSQKVQGATPYSVTMSFQGAGKYSIAEYVPDPNGGGWAHSKDIATNVVTTDPTKTYALTPVATGAVVLVRIAANMEGAASGDTASMTAQMEQSNNALGSWTASDTYTNATIPLSINVAVTGT